MAPPYGGWGGGSIGHAFVAEHHPVESRSHWAPVLDAVVSGERYRLNDIIHSDPCCLEQRDESGSTFGRVDGHTGVRADARPTPFQGAMRYCWRA